MTAIATGATTAIGATAVVGEMTATAVEAEVTATAVEIAAEMIESVAEIVEEIEEEMAEEMAEAATAEMPSCTQIEMETVVDEVMTEVEIVAAMIETVVIESVEEIVGEIEVMTEVETVEVEETAEARTSVETLSRLRLTSLLCQPRPIFLPICQHTTLPNVDLLADSGRMLAIHIVLLTFAVLRWVFLILRDLLVLHIFPSVELDRLK